jgi:hypothetical protein
MNPSGNFQTDTSSPANRHTAISGLSLSIGLFGAPLAWVLQFSLSESLAAHACFPHQMLLSAPLWPGLYLILVIISIVFLALALTSGLMAWRSWQRFKGQLALASEWKISRNQFLLKLSLMSSLIFIIAILFNIVAVVLVSPCSSWF